MVWTRQFGTPKYDDALGFGTSESVDGDAEQFVVRTAAELLRPRRAALHIEFAHEDVVVARIHMPRQGARGVPGDVQALRADSIEVTIKGYRARDGSTTAHGESVTLKDDRNFFVGEIPIT